MGKTLILGGRNGGRSVEKEGGGGRAQEEREEEKIKGENPENLEGPGHRKCLAEPMTPNSPTSLAGTAPKTEWCCQKQDREPH